MHFLMNITNFNRLVFANFRYGYAKQTER